MKVRKLLAMLLVLSMVLSITLPTAVLAAEGDGADVTVTETTESTGTESTDSTEPDTTEPDTTEPDTTEPGTTESGTTEPGTTEPGTTESGTTEPGTTEPGTTEPGTTEPGTTEPGTTEPGTTEPGTTEPGTTEPGTTEPGAEIPDGQVPGGALCEHGNDPATCPVCNPVKCEHGNDPATCPVCNPVKCEHGNDPAACPQCNPELCCEHGVLLTEECAQCIAAQQAHEAAMAVAKSVYEKIMAATTLAEYAAAKVVDPMYQSSIDALLAEYVATLTEDQQAAYAAQIAELEALVPPVLSFETVEEIYAAIMAAETKADYDAILAAISDEQKAELDAYVLTLTEEEQAAYAEKVAALTAVVLDAAALYASLMTAQTLEEYEALLIPLSEEQLAELDTYVSGLSEDERMALLNHVEELRKAFQATLPIVIPEYEPRYTDAGPYYDYGDTEVVVEVPMARAMTLMSANVLYSAAPVSGLTGTENNDGSITYNGNVTVNKTISETSVEDVYELDMTAESKSKVVTTTTGADFILMLDLSTYMNQINKTSYNKLNTRQNATLYSYAQSGTLYYSATGNESDAVQVTVSIEEEGPWWSPYIYTYKAGDQTLGTSSSGNGSAPIPDWDGAYFRSTVTTTTSTERLEALKEAVKGFVEKVAEDSPGSRVAIVSYSNGAEVLTGWGRADGGALVTMDEEGETALLRIADNLTVTTGPSNSDYALAAAVKIFQDENDNYAYDSAGQQYAQRQRVAVLFSAGTAGNGKFKDGNANYPNYDKFYDGEGTGNKVAQGSMHLASILKTPRTENANDNDGGETDIRWTDNFYGVDGFSESEFKSTYGIEDFDGGGATVYCVGLSLPSAGDVARAYQAVETGQRLMRGGEGSRVNEYLFRISQHRPNGTHIFLTNYDSWGNITSYTNDMPETWWEKWRKLGGDDSAFASSGEYENGWGFYPDDLTRDWEGDDGSGSYFMTANDKNLSKLTDIFEDIVKQEGETFDGVIVRDYITEDFILVDQDGNQLHVGDNVTTANGNGTGIVKVDESGRTYVEWTGVTLDPGDTEGNGKETFGGSVYVKPVDSFGGNNLPTNTAASGVYINNENYAFPQPNLTLPVRYEIGGTTQSIYLTQSAEADDLFAYVEGYQPDGQNNAHVTIAYTVKRGDATVGTYTIQPSGITGTWSWTGETAPDLALTDCADYTITCTITPNAGSGLDSLNKPVVSAVTKNADSHIHVFKPTVTFGDQSTYLTVDPGENTYTEGWEDSDGYTILPAGPAPELIITSAADQGADKTGDYVKTVTVKIGSTDVTNDTTFTRTPCTGDSNTPAVSNGQYVVHVFKPSITWKDSKKDFGYQLTSEHLTADNKVGDVIWSHANTNVARPTAQAPTLTYTFTDPDGNSLPETLAAETKVKVTVKVGEADITDETTFSWRKGEGCPNACTDPNPNYQFRIHLNNFDLTVRKTVDGESYDPDDTFRFILKKDGVDYATFTLKAGESATFKNLQAGPTYTVVEDTDWSWRYTCTGGDTKTVTVTGGTAEVTFTNTLEDEQWLSDDASAVNNFNPSAGTNARMSDAMLPESVKMPKVHDESDAKGDEAV